MTAARTAATSVLQTFPEHWHVIGQRYREDDDFRELCDHFAECRDVLARLQATAETRPETADSKRIAEYQSLTDELEQEIRNIVDAPA